MKTRLLAIVALGFVLRAAPAKLPPDLQALVDQAHAAPPEFASNAWLLLVESGKLQDRNAAADLVQQAFDLAASARFPMPMHAIPGVPADSDANYLDKAYALKLDALSLQTRAVLAMLNLDKSKAREMFRALRPLSLKPLTCDDALTYDVSDYYRALTGVVNETFTETERAKEDHVAFAMAALSQITSAAQLAPAEALLRALNVTQSQRDALRVRFDGILEGISGDDRSFSASIEEVSRQSSPDMGIALDKYVVKNLAGTRCAESASTIAMLGGPDATRIEGGARTSPYWQSDTARKLMSDAMKLRLAGGTGRVLSDAERKASDWPQKLADLTNQLAEWKASDERTEADYYHQKAIIYEALVELIPRGDERDKVLQAFTSFIATANFQSQRPAEWFQHAREMLERVRGANGEPDKVLAAYAASGNPALALYAATEKMFRSNLPSWVKLPASGQ